MTDLPVPPVPAEADLSDFPFTPLYRNRLFGSAFHAKATDAEWRAGVTLWLKSQDQFPSGSLPDDDVELCRLAELGRDLKSWRKIRDGALRGWFKCGDGRLYHEVVAEVVRSQWEGKQRQEDRKRGWREKKRSQRGQPDAVPGEAARRPPDHSSMSHGTPTIVPRDVPSENALKGEGQGQGDGEGLKQEPSLRSGSSGAAPPARQPASQLLSDWKPDPIDRAYASNLGLTDGEVDREGLKFRGYWVNGSGAGRRKTPKGWRQAWQNWIAKAVETGSRRPAYAAATGTAAGGRVVAMIQPDDLWRPRILGYQRNPETWLAIWGRSPWHSAAKALALEILGPMPPEVADEAPAHAGEEDPAARELLRTTQAEEPENDPMEIPAFLRREVGS